MKKLFFLLPLISFFIIGCSGSEESMEENKEEVYVFDEIPEEPTTFNETPQITKEVKFQTMYAVQIGAFTSLEAAEEFYQLSKKSVKQELKVEFSSNVGLFIVYVKPFLIREDAEKLRNELWKKKEFADAFVLILDVPIED